MNNIYHCPKELFKSYLKEPLMSYIEYKVNIAGCKADSYIPKLSLFDKYCIDNSEPSYCLKRETVMGFLQLRPNESKSNLYTKAIIVQGFARYMSVVLMIPDVYVVSNVVHKGTNTFIPYVFSHKEIADLLHIASIYTQKQATRSPNLPNCMSCIFPMLYCTGMRISEVLDLKYNDIDLDLRIIHINKAKNDSCRIVTISESLAKAIECYIVKSAFFCTSGVFFFDTGSYLHEGHVSIKVAYNYFRRFLHMAGINHYGRGHGPRMHDFRTTFAVHSLQQLSKLTGDINVHLMTLSVYLGHKSIYCTQDYLWLTGELFQDILSKMEDYTMFVSTILDEKEAYAND
jgi:integrase/recombinase XerD